MRNFVLGLSCLTVASMLAMPVSAQQFAPKKPECIAGAAPGGGWDFVCRTTAKVMFDLGLVKERIQVVNMTGGGGGVAYAHVANERADDDNLIVAASKSVSMRLAQGAYPGNTMQDVRWLAAFGAEYGAIAVAANSDIRTLDDLVASLKDDPRSIAFSGGSSVGGNDHLKILKLAKVAGIEDLRQMKYVAFSGGGEAITQLLAGSVQAISSDFSEIMGFVESGDVRIIAVLSPERLAAFDQFPTAKEQGYDVTGLNWRGLYVPRNMSDEAYGFWLDTVRRMTASDEFRDLLVSAGIEPLSLFDADADALVASDIEETQALSRELGLMN
ncbi:tripartite tricarboxylate transporter substrate binding protein [Paracoccus sp. M683]|uniref:Bug family tripartite tricarboxylate transporter substrate binding protein n=1 Tax=Paracoccus sp. M683 TaxID=2594268 RepID=UPI00117ECD35|nr:tripartite tricarboxylate transporter substrate-binding protein [Paracoccus sp. M683]TRW97844.1 tripartite tricarboxylate transporter substrate binding protein [Paracoccus sp. M683]